MITIDREIYAKRLEDLRKVRKARGESGTKMYTATFFEVYKARPKEMSGFSPKDFGTWLKTGEV